MATSAPIPAPRDWNDEAAGIVATYASEIAPGFHLHSEDTDRGGYNPYFRTSARRSHRQAVAA